MCWGVGVGRVGKSVCDCYFNCVRKYMTDYTTLYYMMIYTSYREYAKLFQDLWVHVYLHLRYR